MDTHLGDAQEMPKETWATQLAGLLSGNALDQMLLFIDPYMCKDYDVVKLQSSHLEAL